MRQHRILVLLVLFSLLASVASAQYFDMEAGDGGDAKFILPEGSMVLYDQTDNAAGNGAPDQDFEAAYDAYDSEGADDFDVDWPGGWIVEQINTIGTTGTPGGATVSIDFYADNGGTPLGGAVVCTYDGVVPTVDNLGSLTIDLPTTCDLPMGLHWVAIQVSQNFGANGQHFWSNRTVQSNNGAVWRNPGGGFGTGCADWTPMTTCGVGGGTNPDFLFSVVGQLGDGGGVELAIEGDECPGFQDFVITGAEANSLVALFASDSLAPTVLDRGRCEGTTVDLGDPQILGRGMTDGAGNVTFAGQFVSRNQCGLFFQVVDLSSCEVSDTQQIAVDETK